MRVLNNCFNSEREMAMSSDYWLIGTMVVVDGFNAGLGTEEGKV